MATPIVFVDIAGPDAESQAAFYRTVFEWEIGADGSFRVPVVAPIPGTLRTDPAATGIYLGVPHITATLALVEANGGSVIAPRFEVPGVVVLGLFTDPAGNRLGLVEMEGDRRRIP
ncbi:MAG TPA: hypothetical protein VFS20_16210 [Longimicrobium sp.]|nr:hypothetical protein [Longimicrobium sp.]